jgi:hypothetical protein
MTEVLQLDPARKTNAQLMADCNQLGYLVEPLIDVTFNKGRFWQQVDPPDLAHRYDLDPKFDAQVADFRDLPLEHGTVRTVVLDPRYKLSGTSSGKGPAALDPGYGVERGYQSIEEIHTMIRDGIDEAARVLRRGGLLLLKCQAQQSSGTMQDQPGLFARHGVDSGFWLDIDRLHVITKPRKQPRKQRSARSNISTLVVLRRNSKPVPFPDLLQFVIPTERITP